MFNNIKKQLRQHLETIAKPRDPYLNTGGFFFVREYIREELSKYGSVEVHEFNVEDRIHENLILNLPADNYLDHKPPILIGAHYDTVPGSPGADDNATGIAVLLELARYFKRGMERIRAKWFMV
ncbi:MAG: M28 family peptidase [Crocosphaera sp.]|uniref:M28 family peptidase n=1 Tax=Crocosphaera sp. TaxID=2729996 RepID=UPI002585C92D|nr:M28 family peptidase [Crocosphaera sp.]MCH2232454.1 M28 family peptidase [Crocinitomicaceae bacterium]MCH2245393.1 M28 family peptidase [Crocosphaera sp.]